jgi:VWFA-related protein
MYIGSPPAVNPDTQLTMRALTAVLLRAGASLALIQQVPSNPPPTFRAGVDVVQVDVSVLDKQRNPVRGLTASDFTVLEDGKPRPVVAFSPIDLPEEPAAPPAAPWLRDVPLDVITNDVRPEGRLVVIMFDWSIRFMDQAVARRIAAAAVNQLGPGDLASVIFTSGFVNGGTPQNFTSDRARLLDAINRPFAVAIQNPPRGSPFHDPRNMNDVMIDDPEGYESGECYCRVCVPEAIARVADAVRDVRGRRKTLLFIGTYVRLYESLQGPTSRRGPEFAPGLAGRPVVHPGVCAGYLKDAREKMVRAASLANLTVHTLDPVGLETDFNSPLGGSIVAQMDRRDDLTALADATGGRAVLNTNAPETLVPAVFAESRAYYLLAFAPADLHGKGKLHKIEVKVSRPGVTIRTRAGYYAGETRAKGIAPALMSPETLDVLADVLPRADVPLRVAAAPFAIPGKPESAVAIVLGVEQRASTAEAGPAGQVKVLAAAFDRNGRSVQSEEQTVGVTRTPDSGAARYEVLSRLALKPGRYEVRVAFDGGPGERASVYTHVDVPDFAQQPLSLSGIAVHASPAIRSAPTDAFADLLPVVPTARRDFSRADRASAFLRIYQQSKDAVQPADITATIQDAAGRTVLSEHASRAADRFAADHSSDYRLQLPLERLETGEYLLTVEATRGKYTARRGLRFAVN